MTRAENAALNDLNGQPQHVLTFADSRTEPQPSQSVRTQRSIKNDSFLEETGMPAELVRNRTSAEGIIIYEAGMAASQGTWTVEHTHNGKKYRAVYLKNEMTPKLD